MIVGVDIGGTKVAAALVTAEGEISHKTRVPWSRQAMRLRGSPP